MKIHTILDVAKHETQIIKTTTRLTTTVEHISHLGAPLKVREMTKISNLTLINNKEVHEVAHVLKKGYMNEIKNVYEIKTTSIPKDLEIKITSDIKGLPAFEFGKYEKGTTQISEGIKNKSPKKSLDHLHQDRDITMTDVNKSPALKSVLEYMRSKQFRTFMKEVIIVGATTLAALTLLNAHRKTMSACLVYYYENNNLKNCRLLSCSCADGQMNDHGNRFPNCTSKILDLLPDDMKQTNQCAGTSGTTCVNCPSQTFRDMFGAGVTDMDKDSKQDQIYVNCQKPSVFDAMGDILHHVTDTVAQVINGAANAASWLASHLPTILIVGACILGVGVVVWFLRFLGIFGGGGGGNRNNNNYRRMDDSYYYSNRPPPNPERS